MPLELPGLKEFYTPTLQAVKNLGGSAAIRVICTEAAKLMELSPEQLEIPHKNDRFMYVNRVKWAIHKLFTIGMLGKPRRGFYALTELGEASIDIDPRQVDREYRNQKRATQDKSNEKATLNDSPVDPSGRRKQPDIREAMTPAQRNPDVGLQAAYSSPSATLDAPNSSQLNSFENATNWRDDLYDRFLSLVPAQLERLFHAIFKFEGIDQVEVSNSMGDHGIEGMMSSNGFLTFRVAFKFVRANRKISAREVEDFRRQAQVSGADKGLLITVGTFTNEAIREADSRGSPKIELVAGEQLLDKLRELGLGVTVRQVVVEQVTVDPDFFATI